MICRICGYALPFNRIEISEHLIFQVCPNCKVVQYDRKQQPDKRSKFDGCKCPWCGNTSEDEFAIVSRMENIATHDDRRFNVECSCGARGPEADSESDAIERFKRLRHV